MTAASVRHLGAALLIAFSATSAPAPARAADPGLMGPLTLPAPDRPDAHRLLGSVRDGVFHAYGPGGAAAPFRLTAIQRQEARSVESGALDLAPLDGRLILVQGVPEGGWIYEATVVETSGPLIAQGVARLLAAMGARAAPSAD